jgi:hypothetical protein
MNNKPAKLVLSQETLKRLTTRTMGKAFSGSQQMNCSDGCSANLPCSQNATCP